jgi:hypothetical protein
MTRFLGLIAGTVIVVSTSIAYADVTTDRHYKMGDDDNGSGVGVLVSIDANNTRNSAAEVFSGQRSAVPPQLNTFTGNPTYVDATGRDGAGGGELGINFDGDDSVRGRGFGVPNYSDGQSGAGDGYDGIFLRGMQAWVRPTSSGSSQRQDIVMDSTQFGVFITENDTWGLQYGDSDNPAIPIVPIIVDTNVSVNFNSWSHVMHWTDGSKAFLWVDGVAIGSTTGQFNSENDPVNLNPVLSVGADANGSNPYTGDVDDLKIFVWGTNDSAESPFGEFALGEDNDYVALNLTGVDGDVNQDGNLTQADVDALAAGWRDQNTVNNLQVGGLDSLANGDLNLNGVTDFDDLLLLYQASIASSANLNFGAVGVPEPSTAILLVWSAASLLLWPRRRCSH